MSSSGNYRTQVSLGSDLWVRLSFTEEPCCRLNLSDEDTNSILTDNANRAIQGYLAMQVTQPGGQLWNQAMQVMSPDDQILNQFATNPSGAIWWTILQLMQIAPSCGQICN